jgi:hypothetical protein
MDEPQVDMSAIRGDWHFHMNYVSHAISVTLARAMKQWAGLAAASPPVEMATLAAQMAALWSGIAADLDSKGSVRVEAAAVTEFEAVCRATREPCDAWVAGHAAGSSHLAGVKEVAEACRQLRALCDDLDLMREQRS